MSNFIWDNTALPAEKADAVDIPSAASEANYITGQNFNDLMTALQESREAVWKGGGRIAPQAEAPVSGTFELGDLVFNSVPADGANVGWICTAAGTPGTWLEFGVIAADVLNGGEGGGGGGGSPEEGDIETPARLYGATAAELGFYADGLEASRQAAIGFLSASTNIFTIQNERSSGAVIHLEPGTGGWVEVTGTGQFEAASIWTDNIYPAAGSDQPLAFNTEDVRIVGANEAWLGFYPDGSANLRATLGYDDPASDTLYLKNQQTSNGHVHLVPGSGAGLKVGGLSDTNLATLKGLRIFTQTVDWTSTDHSDGTNASYTVSGITTGDLILSVGLTTLTSTGCSLSGTITGSNTVNVTLINENESGAVNPGSGTLTILWADLT